MMRSRSPFSRSTCCVSASPSSHGTPPCLMLVSGEAPVPPSWPEIRTTSACALATPAAIVPTPVVPAPAWGAARAAAPGGERGGMALQDLVGDDFDPDAADSRRRPREVL